MAKALIITEKPSVARDVVAALGGFSSHDDEFWESDQFLCTFSVGHILQLLEPEQIDEVYKRWTLENLPIIPEAYKLQPKKGQSDRLKTIKKLVERKDVDRLINACDAGREGELIFREVVKYYEVKKPIERLWLQSMTPQAIRDGFGRLQPGQKYEGLAAAAECRSQADWVIGMNATRALTVRLRNRSMKGAWSAGRVQTPTLAMLVDRELEVLRHIPVAYWQVKAVFAVSTSQEYGATWYDPKFVADETKPHLKNDRLFNREQAEAITAAVAGKQGLARETRKPSQESPRPLFDLTSLQREANSRFGWSAARTLRSAQACYETHKVLTYPRTSSKCLPNDYVPHVENALRVLAGVPEFAAGAQFLIKNGRKNDHKIFDDKGVSDHFAIIPTGQLATMDGDAAAVFGLVTRRFIAAFHPNAVWEQVERITEVANHSFISRARTLREPGWRMVFGQTANDGEGDDKGLPALVPGETAPTGVAVKTNDVIIEDDFTKPPPRITEARLLSLMENAGKQIDDEDLAAALTDKGIGTPATRADVIENLKSKDYVDRGLRPTAKGMRLIDLLERIKAGRLTSPELTGELEMHLEEVERGDRTIDEFMSEINDYARQIVSATREFTYDDIYPNSSPCGVCPCDKKRQVFERVWFYRCQEDPETQGTDDDCPFRIWKDKNGRYIDDVTAKTLLADGKTGELDGFVDRQGRTYKGMLVLDDRDVRLDVVGGAQNDPAIAGAEFEVNPDPLTDCPLHPEQDCKVIETPTHYACTSYLKQVEDKVKKPIGVVLPRMVCKREINRDEALEYTQNGKTPLIEDFISRFGRPFKAMLKRKETGRHEFEFLPREPSAGGRGRWGKGKKGSGKEENAEEGADAEKADKKTDKKAAGKKVTKRAVKKLVKKSPVSEGEQPTKKAATKSTKKAGKKSGKSSSENNQADAPDSADNSQD